METVSLIGPRPYGRVFLPWVCSCAPLQDRQVSSRFKGQSPGLHGPVDRVYGYLEGFPALDPFRRPALLEPSPETGRQRFVLQREGRPTAFSVQTLELVLLVGTVGAFDGISPELPADRRGTSVQGAGDPSEPASLSTALRCPLRGLTVATHTLPIRNFRGRGRLWESVSFAVCARKIH